MTIREILNTTKHRPWEIPKGNWKYYQEWNNAIFLHWQVDYEELRKFVPEDLEIDLYDGKPWISVVAFTMEKIRPKNLPAFPPISDFDEINIRTYVKSEGRTGIYFLSIEGGTKLSCKIAKRLSELPYRFSYIKRDKTSYKSYNSEFKDKLELKFSIGDRISEKSTLDTWLTERYALFQDTNDSINQFEIHHLEWPIKEIDIEFLDINYPGMKSLINNNPDRIQYSTGVKVIAWRKTKRKKLATQAIANAG